MKKLALVLISILSVQSAFSGQIEKWVGEKPYRQKVGGTIENRSDNPVEVFLMCTEERNQDFSTCNAFYFAEVVGNQITLSKTGYTRDSLDQRMETLVSEGFKKFKYERYFKSVSTGFEVAAERPETDKQKMNTYIRFLRAYSKKIRFDGNVFKEIEAELME